MKPGDLVRLRTFSRDVTLMNRGLSGGTAVLVAPLRMEVGVWWDMLVTKDPAYGGSSEFVEGVAEEDIREVLSEAGQPSANRARDVV